MNVLRGNLLPVVIPQKIFKNHVYVSCLFILMTKKCMGTYSIATPVLEE